MQLKIIRTLTKIVLSIALLAGAIALLGFTNSGLNTVLTIAAYFAPVKITYQKAHGTLWGRQIIIANLQVQDKKASLNITEFSVNWRQGTFKIANIVGFEKFLPAQQLLLTGDNTKIALIKGQFRYTNKTLYLNTSLIGTWQNAKLRASLNALYKNTWQLQSAQLFLGNNIARIDATTDQKISWSLQLIQPEIIFKQSSGTLHAAGELLLTPTPTISATLNSKNFILQEYKVKNLSAAINAALSENAPLDIAATADQIIKQQHKITQFKLHGTGKSTKHSIKASGNYNLKNFAAQCNATFVKKLWQTNDVVLNYDKHKLYGNAKYNIQSKEASGNLQGTIFDLKTQIALQMYSLQHYETKLYLNANQANYLTAKFKLNKDQISGDIKLNADDLSLIMQLLPDVTRLKGHLSGKAEVRGTIAKPQVNAVMHLTDITATIPKLGIKIKPMELHIHNESLEKFILRGSGKMRRGPGEFTLNGYIEPFKANMPNELQINGKEIKFVNNSTAHLIADNQLKLWYDLAKQQLNIQGHIDILRGNIFYDPKKTNTIKSKDVVFVDSKAQAKQNAFAVNPNLNIWIFEAVHFSGFGMEANISGNIDVTQRNNTLYGSGRVTIKEGTYQLPGQKLTIHKGRLLYPIGTLLSNPSLDIRLKNTTGSDLDIVVRGTAQAPNFHEATLANNPNKILSQAMLAGSSVLSKNILQEKLKLSELGFANTNQQSEFLSDYSSYDSSNYNHPTHDKNAFKNKDLVIGRPIGDKLYLQYLQSMDSSIDKKRARLKYALNENWSLDLEAGNKGAGADLSFSIER
jgi:autotransporter translocation and assembly factor TamB